MFVYTERMKIKRTTWTRKLGPVAQKILLSLEMGITLGLTTRPDIYFKIVKRAAGEWERINTRSLHDAIRRLYCSQLIECKENIDGSVSMVLSERGKKRILHYRFETITIQKPPHWDGYWRIVLFDVPERLKQGRDALSQKLKQLGFYSLQKSVFIFPYECRNEIDFIVEIFKLRPYVRYLVIKEIDVELDLKHRFHL